MIFFGLLLIAVAIVIGSIIIALALGSEEKHEGIAEQMGPAQKAVDRQMAQIIKKESPVDDFLNKQ